LDDFPPFPLELGDFDDFPPFEDLDDKWSPPFPLEDPDDPFPDFFNAWANKKKRWDQNLQCYKG
jgi:hypothetical protein